MSVETGFPCFAAASLIRLTSFALVLNVSFDVRGFALRFGMVSRW